MTTIRQNASQMCFVAVTSTAYCALQVVASPNPLALGLVLGAIALLGSVKALSDHKNLSTAEPAIEPGSRGHEARRRWADDRSSLENMLNAGLLTNFLAAVVWAFGQISEIQVPLDGFPLQALLLFTGSVVAAFGVGNLFTLGAMELYQAGQRGCQALMARWNQAGGAPN